MIQNNLYIDIKDSIIRHFDFLKPYGFNNFIENQLAYEFHFEAKNDYLKIDIWFENIPSSPIWMKLNQYYLEHIEPENSILKECERLRSKKYDKLFKLYLKKEDCIYLEKIQKSYELNGKEINESYIKESSEIIKRNIGILKGEKIEMQNGYINHLK